MAWALVGMAFVARLRMRPVRTQSGVTPVTHDPPGLVPEELKPWPLARMLHRDPRIPDHVSLWGLLIPIRRAFQQYVNLRPVRLLRGMSSPLAGRTAADLDFYVVRENNEGEYSEVGGRMYRDTDQEMAMQQAIFTRRNTDRIMRFAFELARSRPKKHLTSATKSNGIIFTMPYWDERFAVHRRLGAAIGCGDRIGSQFVFDLQGREPGEIFLKPFARGCSRFDHDLEQRRDAQAARGGAHFRTIQSWAGSLRKIQLRRGPAITLR